MTETHAPAATAGFYLRRVVHLAAVIDGTPADHALCGMNLQYGAIDTTADATCPECVEVAARLAIVATPEQVADAILDRRPILDLFPARDLTRDQAETVDAGVTIATERLAARYGIEPAEVVRLGREVVEETLAPVPVHYSREQIAARFREADEFVLVLGPDDTAYDPETGDTLLGGVTVRYARGEFPGPAHTATIEQPEPAVDDDPRELPEPLEWNAVAGRPEPAGLDLLG